MRADRLVAILLMLQTRGKVTAGEVAAELEVSERTARRDLDALGVAGLPIYSSQGRGGGWELVGGGKTDLSGLTSTEARALFLVAGPSSTATPEVKAALRKLVRALPEGFRASAEAASTSVIVDSSGWDGTARGLAGQPRPTPFLDVVQKAVVDGLQLDLDYVARDRAATTRTVHPLGLAAKGTVWYLLAQTDNGLRTFRVDRIAAADPNGLAVERPDGFDLGDAWRLVTDEVDQRRAPTSAAGLAQPWTMSWLRSSFGTRLSIGPPRSDGRVEVELRGWNVRSLAGEICTFGGGVEVTGPPEVREALASIGAELVELYAGAP